MKPLSGYLVVRCVDPKTGRARTDTRPGYHGVNREPPWPSDDEAEQHAVAEYYYIFASQKDEQTNLIPSFDDAHRLLEILEASSRKHRYEIIFVCEDPEQAQEVPRSRATLERLGYDIANVLGDYYPLGGDFPTLEPWAKRHRRRLNRWGLFDKKSDAEEYLKDCRAHNLPHSEEEFDLVLVYRVQPVRDQGN